MKKVFTATAAAAALALTTFAVPQSAQAGNGGAIAAGIVGGLAAGALIGAAASQPHYYDDGPGRYYEPAPVYYGPDCWWQRERYWNGYRWHSRRVRVCD